MEDRLIALEERLAYQAKLLRELDEVVLEFTRRVVELDSRVRELEAQRDGGEAIEPHDTPPPHY